MTDNDGRERWDQAVADAVAAGVPGAEQLVRKRSESRQRTALVALRLLPSERTVLEATARNRKVSLSEFIRASALAAVKEKS